MSKSIHPATQVYMAEIGASGGASRSDKKRAAAKVNAAKARAAKNPTQLLKPMPGNRRSDNLQPKASRKAEFLSPMRAPKLPGYLRGER